VSHFEVAGGEADDGRFVQLTGDGRRQRQQLGQLEKLCVFLLAATPRCIFALLLHPAHTETMGIKTEKSKKKQIYRNFLEKHLTPKANRLLRAINPLCVWWTRGEKSRGKCFTGLLSFQSGWPAAQGAAAACRERRAPDSTFCLPSSHQRAPASACMRFSPTFFAPGPQRGTF
jgi:hypothetical protein